MDQKLKRLLRPLFGKSLSIAFNINISLLYKIFFNWVKNYDNLKIYFYKIYNLLFLKIEYYFF